MKLVPGVLTLEPELDTLGALSPSRATGLRACALREVWAAARSPALLPQAPAARLGSVAHSLMEEAGEGRFPAPTAAELGLRWEELVRQADTEASARWLDRHLAHLRTAVPDYEVRKLRAISAAEKLANDVRPHAQALGRDPRALCGSEVHVMTPQGTAGGRIDAVVAGPDGVVIKDYKSGAIYDASEDGAGVVKDEYATQLRLYAAIYASMTGTWPARLELAPMAGTAVVIPFSPDQCNALLAQFLQLREDINAIVETPDSLPARIARLAAPSPATCSYCPYRPQCRPYREATSTSPTLLWPLDRIGDLKEITVLGNGRLGVWITTEAEQVWIRGISPNRDRHPALEHARPGDRLGAFSLRPGRPATSFMEGPYTVFYRYTNGAT